MKIQKKDGRAYAAKASALKRLLGTGMLVEGSLNMSMRGGSEHWQLTDKADGKTRTLYVPARHAAEVTECIERWRRARQAMKELSAAAREAFANAFAGRRDGGGSARRRAAGAKGAGAKASRGKCRKRSTPKGGPAPVRTRRRTSPRPWPSSRSS